MDAFHKISEDLLDADDQAIMLVNDVSTIHKKGEEIEKVEHNSAAVKIIALQAMLKIAELMSAKGVEGMQCIVFMDNKDLSFHIHHLDPNVEADKSQADIFELGKTGSRRKLHWK